MLDFLFTCALLLLPGHGIPALTGVCALTQLSHVAVGCSSAPSERQFVLMHKYRFPMNLIAGTALLGMQKQQPLPVPKIKITEYEGVHSSWRGWSWEGTDKQLMKGKETTEGSPFPAHGDSNGNSNLPTSLVTQS